MHGRPPLTLTWRGVVAGIVASTPLLPGLVLFGVAFGAVAAKAHISLLNTVLMSGVVYAGAAQFVAVSGWQESWTLAGAATIVLLVTVVNARLILMGVSLRPWFAGLSRPAAYSLLALNTDASWLMLLRADTEGHERDLGRFLGVAILLWVIWLIGTFAGWYVGNALGDPRRFGLDVVMIVFFAIFLVPLWQGGRRWRSWLVAAAVALLAQVILPGQLYILAGALAGAAAGAWLERA